MNIEQEIEQIKQRNQRVEADKAWEVSWTRGLFIAAVTYLVAGVWLLTIHDTKPWLKALVPAIGYILSTFSIPVIKNWWSKHE